MDQHDAGHHEDHQLGAHRLFLLSHPFSSVDE